jgi:hypothetical protein
VRSLFKPSTQRGYLRVVGPKRATRTLAALYRILSEDFARRRAQECTCKMPMIFEIERDEPEAANWRVEALWCGSIDCQYALTECVAAHAKLYDLAHSGAPDSGWEATGGF